MTFRSLGAIFLAAALCAVPAAAADHTHHDHSAHEGMQMPMGDGQPMDHSKMHHPGDGTRNADAPLPTPEELHKIQLNWLQAAENAVGTRPDPSLTFRDGTGKEVSLASLKGKPYFIAFVFYDCPMICPAITGNMARAAKAARKKLGDTFRLVTVSFDTEGDTPARAGEYGSGFTPGLDWTFGVAVPGKEKAITGAFGYRYMPHPKEVWSHITMVSAVNADGVLVKQLLGSRVDQEEFDATLAGMLGK